MVRIDIDNGLHDTSHGKTHGQEGHPIARIKSPGSLRRGIPFNVQADPIDGNPMSVSDER
jgi:hypothetical protein